MANRLFTLSNVPHISYHSFTPSLYTFISSICTDSAACPDFVHSHTIVICVVPSCDELLDELDDELLDELVASEVEDGVELCED